MQWEDLAEEEGLKVRGPILQLLISYRLALPGQYHPHIQMIPLITLYQDQYLGKGLEGMWPNSTTANLIPIHFFLEWLHRVNLILK